MTAFTETESKDHKPKKLTASQAQVEFEKKFTAYMEERFLNLTQQLRATCIAAGVSPEAFWGAFINDKAQDDFYIRLHAQEDLHNAAVGEQDAQAKTD